MPTLWIIKDLANQQRWKCRQDHPRRQFSVRVGTIFEESPLYKWLAAVWMTVNAKNGISSYEVHRALGVTQKTACAFAWRCTPVRGCWKAVEVDGRNIDVDLGAVRATSCLACSAYAGTTIVQNRAGGTNGSDSDDLASYGVAERLCP